MKMMKYEVTVFTSDRVSATTLNNVFIKLVGTDGESERKLLISLRGASAFVRGAEASFTVSCPSSIGKLVMIEVDKQPLPLFPADSWFPAKVEVRSPEGDSFTFPIYRWITDSKTYLFREGTALRVFEDLHRLGQYSREQELLQRHKDYCWNVYVEGIPHCMKSDSPQSLPCEVRFSFTKEKEFLFTASAGLTELKLKGLADSKKSWTHLDDINRVFCCKKTSMSEYVQEHWKEDAFFGFQFLNGVNPIMIRRCTALPSNFPVTDSMVFPDGQASLAEEMQKGHIFLCDYKNMDGVQANIVNG
ncbi:transcript variant X3, partial [Nothobranchius furzeri]